MPADTRHGDGYARDAAALQETVEELVVEEELGDELAGARVRLFAEVEDILGDARRFGVSFGVAGGEDVEVAALLYELDEVGGVREIAAFGHAFGEIAAQGEYVLDTRVAYARYAVLGVRPRHADAGQVHDALHPRALDLGGDRQRDFAVFGAARAVGDADEIGGEVFQALHRGVDPRDGVVALGREHLEGEHRPPFSEEITCFHRALP